MLNTRPEACPQQTPCFASKHIFADGLTITEPDVHVVGNNNRFLQPHVIATGCYNIVMSDRCHVNGNHNAILGTDVTVNGDSNDVSGIGSTVVGNNNTVHGDKCDVDGKQNRVKGQSNSVFGDPEEFTALPVHFEATDEDKDDWLSEWTQRLERFLACRHERWGFRSHGGIGPSTPRTEEDSTTQLEDRALAAALESLDIQDPSACALDNAYPNWRAPPPHLANASAEAAAAAATAAAAAAAAAAPPPPSPPHRRRKPRAQSIVSKLQDWIDQSLDIECTPTTPDTDQCAVCMDNVRRVLYDPCEHINVCIACTLVLARQRRFECPICKKEVTEVAKVRV